MDRLRKKMICIHVDTPPLPVSVYFPCLWNMQTYCKNVEQGIDRRKTRFASKFPANEILSKIEEAAMPLGLNVEKQNYKLKLKGEKSGRKGHLAITTEVFEVVPSLYMVELCKSTGDTFEFCKVHKNLSTGLKDIVWKSQDEANGSDEI